MLTNKYEFTNLIAKYEMMYRETAKEAQAHRELGHEMTVSTLDALVANDSVVSLDCSCGERFTMPFIRKDLLQ